MKKILIKIFSLVIILFTVLAVSSCTLGYIQNPSDVAIKYNISHESVTYKITTKTVIKKAGFLWTNKTIKGKTTYKMDATGWYIKSKIDGEKEEIYCRASDFVTFIKEDDGWEKEDLTAFSFNDLVNSIVPEEKLLHVKLETKDAKCKNGKWHFNVESYVMMSTNNKYRELFSEELDSDDLRTSTKIEDYIIHSSFGKITKTEVLLSHTIEDVEKGKTYTAETRIEIKLKNIDNTKVNLPIYLYQLYDR